MRTLHIKLIVLLTAMLICTKQIKAQLPVNDTAWVLHTAMSDEFNESSINTTLWDTTYCYWDTINHTCNNVNNGAEWDFGRNISMTGTTVKIKADTLNPNKVAASGTFPLDNYSYAGHSRTYAYQGGVIHTDVSRDTLYTYGYVEIRAKYPSHKYPLWPAFWLNNTPSCCYNEIDICENGAGTSNSGYIMGTNYHVTTYSLSSFQWGTGEDCNVLATTDSLSGAFHKYACQWSPTRITYYFDDNVVRTVYDSTGTSMIKVGMQVFMNFCIDPWYAYLPSDWNDTLTYHNPVQHGNNSPTSWPRYFEIDYFHYYTLIGGSANCSNSLTICSPIVYNRNVYSTITTGGSGCTTAPTFNPSTTGTSYTLRATNSVLLDAGTTINPSGTGYFAIDMTACP
ncbi:MAG: glycoside hydrolase family 16 protein [Bacteroidia bacterium]